MTLSAPKQITFIIGALLWLLGLLGMFVPAIAALPLYPWYCVVGGLILILGCLLDGF